MDSVEIVLIKMHVQWIKSTSLSNLRKCDLSDEILSIIIKIDITLFKTYKDNLFLSLYHGF